MVQLICSVAIVMTTVAVCYTVPLEEGRQVAETLHQELASFRRQFQRLTKQMVQTPTMFFIILAWQLCFPTCGRFNILSGQLGNWLIRPWAARVSASFQLDRLQRNDADFKRFFKMKRSTRSPLHFLCLSRDKLASHLVACWTASSRSGRLLT